MDVGSLYGSLGLETDEFDKGLSGAENRLGETEGRFSKLGGVLSTAMGTMAGIFGVQLIGGIASAVGAGVGAVVGFSGDAAQSVKDLEATLGVTKDEATALGNVAETVFKNNWGGSIQEVTAEVGRARQMFGDLADNELQGIVEGAFAISDTFGEESGRVQDAAKTLMDNFGLSHSEAMDLISSGFQNGLNRSGDFLDSIGEYSVQFEGSKDNAAAMFSVMESGLQGGVLGTDKAVDAFKEWRIRAQEGAEATRTAMADAGIDVDKFYADMESGAMSTTEGFDLVKNALAGIEDPIKQNTLGVALMGTQWEDLGPKAALALTTSSTSLADMAGATDSLNAKYANWPSMWEGIKRTALVAFQPIGDKLLEMGGTLLPLVGAAFTTLTTVLVPVITAVLNFIMGLSDLVSYFRLVITEGDTLNGYLSNFPTFLQPVIEMIGNVVAKVMEWVAGWQTAGTSTTSVVDLVRGYIETGFGFIQQFLDKNQDTIRSIIETAWKVIGGVVDVAVALITNVIIPAFTAIMAFIQNNQDTIRGMIEAAWNMILGIIRGALTILHGVVETALGILTGDWSRAWLGIQTILQGVWTVIQSVVFGALEIIKGYLTLAWEAIRATVETVWNGIRSWLSGAWDGIKSDITGKLAAIAADLITKWGIMRTDAQTKWDEIREDIRTLWGRIKDNIAEKLQEIRTKIGELLGKVKDAIAEKWSEIESAAKTAWGLIVDGIKEKFSDAVGKVKEVLGDIKTAITGYKDTISSAFTTAFSGAAGAISAAISAAVGSVRSAINGVISLINGAIDSLNTLPGMNMPTVPQFAMGTENFRGGLALVGEAGPELAMLPGGTSIIPNKGLSGLGGNTYNLNVYTEKSLGSISSEFSVMQSLAGA